MVLVLYCQSCYSLAGMNALRANGQRKRCSRYVKLAKSLSGKTTEIRQITKIVWEIADFDLIINQLNDYCKICSATPLLLTRCKLEDVSHLNLLLIVCQQSNAENRIIIHSSEVEEKLAQ